MPEISLEPSYKTEFKYASNGIQRELSAKGQCKPGLGRPE